MKRDLFIILTSILLVLVLNYLYDKKIEIHNQEYKEKNININYPIFNQNTIDKPIIKYLNKYLENIQNNSLYIDYDYQKENQNIYLTMYIHEQKENIIKENNKNFKINLKNQTIKPINQTKKNIEYDIINQKIITKDTKLIALTFDDGPNYNTNKILTILEKYNIKATFFILGRNIKGNEEIIKKMNELNMEIGNHMYSHKLLTKLKNEEIINEIKKTDNLIFSITNKKPNLIRPSYGIYNKQIKKIINKPIITWNIDPEDWKYHSSPKIYKKVIANAHDGDIILMHDIYQATANSLELIIPKLLNKGYKFVTISELFYEKNIPLEKEKVYNHAH